MPSSVRRGPALSSGASNGYTRDADFEFAFSSYEDALALAGRPVADAWASVRQSEEGQLYGTLAAALAGGRETRTPSKHDPPTWLQRIASRGVRSAAPPHPVDATADLADAWFALDA